MVSVSSLPGRNQMILILSLTQIIFDKVQLQKTEDCLLTDEGLEVGIKRPELGFGLDKFTKKTITEIRFQKFAAILIVS